MPPHRPLSCRTVERVILRFGFEEVSRKSGTSHRQFKRVRDGRMHKVTLDCHRGEVRANDVRSIIGQMGITAREFWRAVDEV